jgi:hypothetical protein
VSCMTNENLRPLFTLMHGAPMSPDHWQYATARFELFQTWYWNRGRHKHPIDHFVIDSKPSISLTASARPAFIAFDSWYRAYAIWYYHEQNRVEAQT